MGPKYERCQISNLTKVERLQETAQKQDAERKRSTDRTVEGRQLRTENEHTWDIESNEK